MRPAATCRLPPPPAEPLPFLPASPEEVRRLGWEEVDVVLVSGDAYVDHPSFGTAVVGRLLETLGLRIAILAQPDWRSVEPFRVFGRPRLFFGVGAGNMDSMIHHYTAQRKPRSDDPYTPGGRSGRRPDRATNVYAQRCREAFPGTLVVAGGVEASLRRVAHYDYWSDRVLPSILETSKADLLVYGMAERTLVELVGALRTGSTKPWRRLRGVAYRLGAREAIDPWPVAAGGRTAADDTVELPSFEAVREDPRAFALATRLVHLESNPYNARRLVQPHGDRRVVVNPPQFPLTREELDAVYELPFAREPHPRYVEPIPAFETMRTSVTATRGCFGGCTFCSITMHQGRIVQSRSPESILREVDRIAAREDFKGTISDIGGPTANMYEMRCSKPEVEAKCRRLSCVHPTICKLLRTDHDPLLEVLEKARRRRGVKRVFVASGIRMDLARRSRAFVSAVARFFTGGHLKVAPEHIDERVLDKMKKPQKEDFEAFAEAFEEESARAGKEQYLVPYFIASHPGSTLESMIELALYLKRNGYRPRQVQDFIPAPMDVATCMYHTGLDPFTLEPVPVAKRMRERKYQRALLQFFDPANWFLVREALRRAGREDLIGRGPGHLIPPEPPPEAIRARRRAARRALGSGPEGSGRSPSFGRLQRRGGSKRTRAPRR